MSLNPVTASREIFARYCNYIATTFGLNDDVLNSQIVEALQKPGRFARGPILEVTPPFVGGHTIEDLISAQVLTPHLRNLDTDKLPLDRPLFLHQEEAVIKICQEQRNAVVATGTGSGKTECFMIPILNHLFAELGQGNLTPGVRALLLYPMNALANDQIKRMRGLLANQPQITFGIYTGETEERYLDAYAKYQRMHQAQPLPNELICREQMKASPPHILLTNYAMLEYLMLRPADNVFFQGTYAQDWKFIVIDEAHTYTGAKGIEMAMLLARLKNAIGAKPGDLRCILTSASLGRGREDANAVAKFAGAMFREEFTESDIITATRLEYGNNLSSPWGRPAPSLYKKLLAWLNAPNIDTGAAKALLEDAGVPQAQAEAFTAAVELDDKQALYQLLRGDSWVQEMIDLISKGPADLVNLAADLFGEKAAAVEDITALVDLCNRARCRAEDNPLLPARFHFLVKALEGAFIALADEPQVYLERVNRVILNGQEYRAFELGACTRCRGLYVIGEVTEESDGFSYLEPVKNQYHFAANSRMEYFALTGGEVEETENEDDVLEGLGLDVPKFHWHRLCVHCGGIGLDNGEGICGCANPKTLRVLKVSARGKDVHKCGLCGSVNSRASVVRRFYLSEDAISTVLATSLYQQLPRRVVEIHKEEAGDDDLFKQVSETAAAFEDKRTKQLLVFSDSRQNAAYFATYLSSTYRDLIAKNLLVQTVEANREECLANNWSLLDFNRRVISRVQSTDLIQDSYETLSQEVWKWIMREFAVETGLSSLENMGLLAFAPDFTRIAGSEILFNLKFIYDAGFSQEEAQVLFTFFLDQFRVNRAVEYPEAVGPQDEFFAPKNQQGGFWLQKPPGVEAHPSGYSLKGWLPASSSHSNTRLDYLLRLLAAGGVNASVENGKELLAKIFEAITHVRSPLAEYIKTEQARGSGKIYKLDPSVYKVMPGRENRALKYYRCDACHKVTWFNLRGVCPSFRCRGNLYEVDLDQELRDNHYRYLYLNLRSEPMKAHEHTAQLATEYAAEVQTRFVQGDINVLSCSTTFELGVDVGELETVFMKNVPPTPANYAQRAGRAGRRTDSTAYALTFARLASHDFSQFRQPEKMISGVVRPPYFDPNNTKIAKRHLYACAFAQFWRSHPEYFRTVDDFFNNDGPVLFKQFLDSRPQALLATLREVIPDAIQKEIGVHDWAWVEEMYASDGVMTKVVSELKQDLKAIEEALDEAIFKEYFKTAGRLKRIRNTIVTRPLINYLSQKNTLPKYGFPVDVVNLDVNFHSAEARNIDLSRDMQIAISEYAPGSQVVANGKLWTSRYVKKVPSQELVRYKYMQCRCGYFSKDLDVAQDTVRSCPVCGAVQTGSRAFVLPEFGFIADARPMLPGNQRPERTYSGRKFFSGVSQAIETREFPVGRHSLYLSTHTHGVLTVVNNGHGFGFYICQNCGYGTLDKIPENHKNSLGRECKGVFERVSLGYDFETDIVEIDFSQVLGGLIPQEGYWESFMYGIIEGLSDALEIDRQDIDGTLYVNRSGRRTIVLFDTVPGGAGHVKRILEGDNCLTVLKSALRLLESCDCGGEAQDTSCYGCLRNYRNQFIHDKLRRDYAIDALQRVLGS
ncbi:MAG: DEAD/DEAH box helicase [Firmicutes bacterium]|nr:DEAD/DEAH box helicase [Bacillota bacterium]